MYIAVDTLKQTLKLFIISTVCSAIFTSIISIDAVYAKPQLCFLLLIICLVLFAFISLHSFRTLYYDSVSMIEYVLPTCTAYVIYICAAAVMYSLRLSNVYNWIFLPPRFLEPIFDNEKISFVAAHIIMAGVIFFTPIHEGGF